MVFISYRASNSPRPRDGKGRKTVEHFEKLHRPGSQITGGDKEPWFSWLDGATIPPYGKRRDFFPCGIRWKKENGDPFPLSPPFFLGQTRRGTVCTAYKREGRGAVIWARATSEGKDDVIKTWLE